LSGPILAPRGTDNTAPRRRGDHIDAIAASFPWHGAAFDGGAHLFILPATL